MLLAVDIGNTNVHCALFDGPELCRRWRVATDAARATGDVGLGPGGRGTVSAAVICSVAPSAAARVGSRLVRDLRCDPLWVRSAAQTGLTTRYADPDSVGIDRLVACRAALEAYHRDAVVVDFGTAITVDLVTSAGVHLGGAIGPGMEAAVETLAQRAELLNAFELAPPRRAIGVSTQECLQVGFVRGFAGLVDRLVEDAVAEASWSLSEVACVATGGRAELFVGVSRCLRDLRPALVLEGLRAIWQDAQTHTAGEPA